MSQQIWVDKRGLRAGMILVLLGFVVLLATMWLDPGGPSATGCGSLLDTDRARECVAAEAQAIDRQQLVAVGLVVLAIAAVAFGGTLVARARRRVMCLDEAAALLGTNRAEVRDLVSTGDLVTYARARGRSYVEVSAVERLARSTNGATGVLPEGV